MPFRSDEARVADHYRHITQYLIADQLTDLERSIALRVAEHAPHVAFPTVVARIARETGLDRKVVREIIRAINEKAAPHWPDDDA